MKKIFKNHGLCKRSGGIHKNKRGEDMLVDFWAILVFAIIVVLFLIVFSSGKHKAEKNVNTEFSSKDTDYMLNAFLRAPLASDPSRTVSDVIIEDSINNNFDDTRKLFDEYFRYTNTMSNAEINDILLKIDGEHDARLKMITEKGLNGFGKAIILTGSGSITDNYYAEAYIPGYTGRIRVTLRLSEIIQPGEDEETGENDDSAAAAKTSASDTDASTTANDAATGEDNSNDAGKDNENSVDWGAVAGSMT